MSSKQKVSGKGLLVWSVCAAFFMYEFLLRTILGTFQYSLTIDLNLTPLTFSLLSVTAYQIAYGFMQIPVGMITDKLGLKISLLIAVVVCVFACLGFSYSYDFLSAGVFRFLMGMGSSFGFVCLLVAVYDWMPHKNIGFFIGMSQFIGTMGPMLAAGPVNLIIDKGLLQWRGLFVAMSVFGVFLFFMILLFVQKNRETTSKFTILTKPSVVLDNLKDVLKSPQIWFIALFTAAIYFSIEYFSENEGKLFLMQKGFTSQFSANMLTLSWLAYAIGCPFLGFLSDKLEKRKPLMVSASICMICALCIIIYAPVGKIGITAGFMLLGLGASGQSLGYAIVSEQLKASHLAVGMGFNNGMTMSFSAFNAPILGSILSGMGETSQGGYAVEQYQIVFSIMVGLSAFAFIISKFFIKETYCKSNIESTKLNY